MSRLAFGNSGSGSGYHFGTLPEVESDASDDVYVCEFTGSAAANEVGVGGGLTGSNLVLTQEGSVSASADGWRTIVDRSNQTFTASAGMLDNFFSNPIGWSAMWKIRNINTTGDRSGGVMLLYIRSDTLSLNYQRADIYYAVRGVISGSGCLPNLGKSTLAHPTGTPLYLTISVDYLTGLVFSAFSKSAQPKRFLDCIAYNIDQSAIPPAAPAGAGYDRTYIIGHGSGTPYISNGCDIGLFCMAKYPVITFS